MKKFEYKLINISSKEIADDRLLLELNDAINRMGLDGWELVRMEPVAKGSYMTMGSKTSAFLMVFKRELE
jgi:hypothetical protein